ncbi:MAG: hypothetical protein DME05_06610 [Candidatus Rokuibacteriota bacterium]|nr:MAG: hypothetical protein DME05_06610 [Candidatus Rokubacteria bacterium]PYN71806.1 MAG: hypothetical protein DMD97_26025 [Candidatus Rokubacteria bacterium]
MKRTVAIGLVALTLGLPLAGWADDGQQVAYGAGSALGTLVYAPVKASFCILGAIGSGFTYMVDSKTAGKVAQGSCGGTWVITPSAVAGKEPVRFVGTTQPRDGERKVASGIPERSGARR